MKKSPRKKKILFLARLFFPHIGGVEKHLFKVSEKLQQLDYEVTIITEQYDKSLPLREDRYGLSIIRIPTSSGERMKKFQIWKWMIRNRSFISKFDIIHVHDVFYWLYPLLIGLDRKNIFMTFHGYEGYPITLRQKLHRKIAEKLSRRNICVGDFMRKWYGTNPDIVIYGAAEENTSEANRIKKYSALFFGRLDDQTGIEEYYAAFQRIRKKYKNFVFQVIGEGKYKKKLDGVRVKPFDKEVDKKITQFQFVFVSRYLSMLEAMLNRRVIIAVYDNPVKRDYLYDSPFAKHIEICKSSDEVYQKVDFYINNPQEEKKKIEAAYRWAKKQTWEKVAQDYRNLWSV